MRRLSVLPVIFILIATLSCSAKRPLKVAKLDVKEKDDPYFLFIKADLLSMKGEPLKSTAELKKLIEKHPKIAFFHYLLSQNLGRERRYGDAAQAVKQAIELSPDFYEARIYLAKLYVVLEKHAEAVREFSILLHDYPRNEEIYTLLTNEYIVVRDYPHAVETLRYLLKMNPDAVVAYYYLGAIYESHFHDTPKALGMYQEALSIDPTNVNVHNAIAELYLKHKKFKKALVKYQELAHLEPDDIAIQLRIAVIHYELKEFDQATAIFEEILAKNPNADKIRFYLGILYEGAGRTDKALDEFAEVPPNSSYFKDARLHMASLYRSAGKNDDAVMSLRDAIARKKQVSEFYEYLAALLEEGKEYQEAIAVLEEGRRAIPTDEKIVFLLGVLYEKVRDRDRAIEAMRAVLKINPQNAGALNYIGYTYAEMGENLDEALAMVEQALVLKPDDGYIIDSLGWVYFKRGDLDHALKYLLKANRIVPGEPTILGHIGEVLQGRGDIKGAIKYYEMSLDASTRKQDPDEKEREHIRQKLSEIKTK